MQNQYTIEPMKNSDEKFMARVLKLARLGGRAVSPNPMVGAMIVKNNRVISEGYHERFGGPHAEVNAIRSVRSTEDLKGATMYVTLEPCRHYGKTPPCLEAVRRVGITRVVCGSRDPFQKVSLIGGRADKLGLRMEFLEGPVSEECQELNKFFFTWVIRRRPFITVKVAVSADGFVAGVDGASVRFTTTKQDFEVHRLRASHQAILVGINTVLADDPELNVRHAEGADPLRVILDSRLRIPEDAKVLKDGNYLIATTKKSGHRGLNVWVSPTQKQVSLKKLFRHLANNGISSVLVEPGPTLYDSLKKQGLIDELVVYRGKKKLREGLKIGL